MGIFNILAVYLVILTGCLSIDMELEGLRSPTNITQTVERKVDLPENIQKGEDNLQEKVDKVEQQPLTVCPDSKKQSKTSKPEPKSTKVPINLVIDTKPRTIPIKIPLVIKTANVKPAPAHYVRLKSDPDRIKSTKSKIDVDLSTNKDIKKIKVPSTHEDTHRSSTKSERKNEKSTSHRHKSKNLDFYEDGTSFKSLAPKSKTAKQKISENKKDSVDRRPCKTETSRKNKDEVLHIKNGTHIIRIMKLPESDTSKTGLKEQNETFHNTTQEQVLYEPSNYNVPLDQLEVLSTPIIEDVTLATLSNDDMQDPNIVNDVEITPILSDNPVLTYSAENVSETPDVITITGHNYEELEERSPPALYLEQSVSDDATSELLPAQPWNPVTNNAYDYMQNYQFIYDQYLKSLAENNKNLYKNKYCYPRVNILSYPTSISDYMQTYPCPTTQIAQDVYGWRAQPQSVIEVRPENALGRIWRTWKDTEVKINRPNFCNNIPLAPNKNINEIKYATVISKPSTVYGPQTIGCNEYYNTINNALTSQYPYSAYRYIL